MNEFLDILRYCVKHDNADVHGHYAYLSEEVGEIAHCLNAYLKGRTAPEPIEMEIADTLISTLGLLVYLNPDITEEQLMELLGTKIKKWEARTDDRCG
jgi:NTP pyrophosphatase (non-canonical NTP hydrolase)